MEATIKRAANGWIAHVEDETWVYRDHESEFGDREAFVEMIRELADYFDMRGGRYDAKRFWAILEPGDKYMDGQEYLNETAENDEAT